MRATLNASADVGKYADLFAAHTISQRLRTLRKIPPELIPLGMCPACSYVGSLRETLLTLFTGVVLA